MAATGVLAPPALVEHVVMSEAAAASPELERLLGARLVSGADLTSHVSRSVEETAYLARRAAESGADRVVVAGGDGTVNAAVNGLMEANRQVPLGIVPLGTANDAAVSLGLPADPIETLEGIWSGRFQARRVDVARCGSRWFLNVLSIGKPAKVTRDTPIPMKQALGGLAYLAYGLTQVVEMDAFQAVLQAPGFLWQGAAFAIYVGNGRSAGGGFNVVPDADMRDGMLDVLIVPEMDIGNLLSLFGDTALLNDPSQHEYIVHHRCPSAHLSLQRGTAINVDGEPIEAHQLELGVARRALEVLAPVPPPKQDG